jgi:hypothetical protein
MELILDVVAKYWLQFLCSILSALLIKGFAITKRQLDDFKIKQDAIKNSVVGLIKERISRSHTYWVQKGYCPISALESIELVYNQLKELEPSETYDNLIKELRSMKHYDFNPQHHNNEDDSDGYYNQQ